MFYKGFVSIVVAKPKTQTDRYKDEGEIICFHLSLLCKLQLFFLFTFCYLFCCHQERMGCFLVHAFSAWKRTGNKERLDPLVHILWKARAQCCELSVCGIVPESAPGHHQQLQHTMAVGTLIQGWKDPNPPLASETQCSDAMDSLSPLTQQAAVRAPANMGSWCWDGISQRNDLWNIVKRSNARAADREQRKEKKRQCEHFLVERHMKEFMLGFSLKEII